VTKQATLGDRKVSYAVIDERGRAILPVAFARQISWLGGAEPVDAWLLTIEPGRYRILSRQQVTEDEKLSRLTEPAIEQPGEACEPFESEPAERLVLQARLLPILFDPPPPAWRVTLSNVPPPGSISKSDRVCVWFPEGYPEIWSTARLATAFAAPLESLL
jgi:hypothetical protein